MAEEVRGPFPRWAPHLFRTRHFAVEQARKRSWPVFSAAVGSLGRPGPRTGVGAGRRNPEALRHAGWDEPEGAPRVVRTYVEWCKKPDPAPSEHLSALLDVLRITAPEELPGDLPSGLSRPQAVEWVVAFLRARLDKDLEAGTTGAEDYAFTDEVIAGLATQSPVGDLLRDARRAAGLSQQQLAEELGCSVASVVVWERAVRPVDAPYRAALCRLLSLEPHQLD
jgi:DNA-binding transcriptional regulator YiaG